MDALEAYQWGILFISKTLNHKEGIGITGFQVSVFKFGLFLIFKFLSNIYAEMASN